MNAPGLIVKSWEELQFSRTFPKLSDVGETVNAEIPAPVTETVAVGALSGGPLPMTVI